MIQIICQLGFRRHAYLTQNSYSKLREDIVADFPQLSSSFDMMYVDEENGDWMILENQRDLNKITKFKREHYLMKIIPKSEEKEKDIGKLVVSEQMKKMIEDISSKCVEKYMRKKISNTPYILDNYETKIQPQTKSEKRIISDIFPQIQQRMKIQRPSKKISRLSPSKSNQLSLEEQVDKAVTSKIDQILPNIIQQSLSIVLESMTCRSCLQKQLQIQKVINRSLLNKTKSKLNPEE